MSWFMVCCECHALSAVTDMLDRPASSALAISMYAVRALCQLCAAGVSACQRLDLPLF